jgi:hypothetical protein
MKKIYRKIEEILMQEPASKREIIALTHQSYDGIRGRISEMRKLGYDIRYVPVKEKKYVLFKRANSCDILDREREWTAHEENILRGSFFTVDISVLSNRLNRSKKDIHDKAVFMGLILK